MWKSYFKISLRSLWRHRFYTFINITGLSVGVACCLLILLFIKHDLSYDTFYKDHDQIYRVALNGRGLYTPALLGKQFQDDYPQVEAYTRIGGLASVTFVVGENVLNEDGGLFADSTFFNVFSADFLEGEAGTALENPKSVVLTKSVADKYFPAQKAIGKVIKADGESTIVSGVVADPPTNTHLPYRYILAMPDEEWVTAGNWTANNFYTYVKLQKGYPTEELAAQMPAFVEKYIGPELISFSGHATFDEYLDAGNEHFFTFLPLADIHLHHPKFSLGKAGDINNIFIFSAVALFILVIACINFINLTTAKSASRSKEVGMRQVLGAVRSELVRQFLVESFLVSLAATILALGLVFLLLPFFNQLSGKVFGAAHVFTSEILLSLGALFLIIGLLAGSYPALHLSGLKPVTALKGELQGAKSSAYLRRILVSFQFGVSIFLVIATVIVFSQLTYISSQKLGIDTSQILVVKDGQAVKDKTQVFREQLLANPNIEEVSISDSYPSERHSNRSYMIIGDNVTTYNLNCLFTEDRYLQTMGIELVEGRFFEKTRATDTAGIVINQAAARELGWSEPVGKKLSRGRGKEYTVIGVIKDYNYYSLKNQISPLIIHYEPEIHLLYPSYLVRTRGDHRAAVAHVSEVWASMAPEEHFNYTFLDDSFGRLYEAEERFGKVFTTFSVLAIIIACLGLFALAAFTLEKRFKEIAIRKVLGASVFSITWLVLLDFTKMVLLGAAVAVPAAFYLAEAWLENFQYRLNLNGFLFVVPVMAIIIIAWLTVAYQSVKTALANPVIALKQE